MSKAFGSKQHARYPWALLAIPRHACIRIIYEVHYIQLPTAKLPTEAIAHAAQVSLSCGYPCVDFRFLCEGVGVRLMLVARLARGVHLNNRKSKIMTLFQHSSNRRAVRVPGRDNLNFAHRVKLVLVCMYDHPSCCGVAPSRRHLSFTASALYLHHHRFVRREVGLTSKVCTWGSAGFCFLFSSRLRRLRHPQPTEFNTCVFKLEVKNPADPADVPNPLPKGTSFAAGPRRTMNVFRYTCEEMWPNEDGRVQRTSATSSCETRAPLLLL